MDTITSSDLEQEDLEQSEKDPVPNDSKQEEGKSYLKSTWAKFDTDKSDGNLKPRTRRPRILMGVNDDKLASRFNSRLATTRSAVRSSPSHRPLLWSPALAASLRALASSPLEAPAHAPMPIRRGHPAGQRERTAPTSLRGTCDRPTPDGAAAIVPRERPACDRAPCAVCGCCTDTVTSAPWGVKARIGARRPARAAC